MISPDIMTLPAAGQDFYGKTAGELFTNGHVDIYGNVTGTFPYVTGYTGFNDAEIEEQEGYYFPFCLVKAGSQMSFLKNGEPVKENISWEANNVLRITKTDSFEIKVDGESAVTFNFERAVFLPKSKKEESIGEMICWS